jgi:hypothetical protein
MIAFFIRIGSAIRYWCYQQFYAKLSRVLPPYMFHAWLKLTGWKKCYHQRDGSKVTMKFEKGTYEIEQRMRRVDHWR